MVNGFKRTVHLIVPNEWEMFYNITFDRTKTGISVLMKAIRMILTLLFQFNLVLTE